MFNTLSVSSSSSCCHLQATRNSFKNCHWVEIAILVSAVILLLLAALAFSQTGVFAHSSATLPFGYCCLVVGLTLFLAEMMRRILLCYNEKKETVPSSLKHSSEPLGENKEKGPVVVTKTFVLPAVPPKKQPGTPINKTKAMEAGEKTYSPHMPAHIKMGDQLYYAILEGQDNRNKKKEAKSLFSISLEAPIEPYVDKTVDFPFAGAASAANKSKTHPKMEDAHVIEMINLNQTPALFAATFDGHGDDGKTANGLKQNLSLQLQLNLSAELDDTLIANFFTENFIELNEKFKKGSTACCLLILPECIYTINAGDSKALLIRERESLQLNEEAKPSKGRFARAIEKLGGTITNGKIGAGKMALDVARSIGDGIAARPKITKIFRGMADDPAKMRVVYGDDHYIVIATDGYWDVATNEETRDAILAMAKAKKTPQEMAGYLVETALRAQSKDNISVLVVKTQSFD